MPAAKHTDVVIQAVASRSIKTARKYAEKYQIPDIYDNYDVLIHSKEIDALYISLPNSLHFEYVKKALLAKKHVLCEKPICLSYDEIKELEEIALENDLFLMDALHYYFYPPLISLMESIQTHFESIRSVEAFLGFPRPIEGDIRLNPTVGGGAYSHMGCYLTHFITWLFPDIQWTKENFQQTMLNGVDIITTAKIKSVGDPHINYNLCVTYNNQNIDSWVKIKSDDYEMTINHAFTPTTFYDLNCPHKNLISIETNHPSFLKAANIINPFPFTTYDYQLDYFLKKIKEPILKQELHLYAYRLKDIIGAL